MQTGPQQMPVFNDANIAPEEKRDIIAFLKTIEDAPQQGGHALGSLGPVSEGWFAWVFGLGILIATAVWLGQKSA
jgi:ubiquinol-cytochrome c reductase cytochrome c subunit